jgi:hypothetical protein
MIAAPPSPCSLRFAAGGGGLRRAGHLPVARASGRPSGLTPAERDAARPPRRLVPTIRRWRGESPSWSPRRRRDRPSSGPRAGPDGGGERRSAGSDSWIEAQQAVSRASAAGARTGAGARRSRPLCRRPDQLQCAERGRFGAAARRRRRGCRRSLTPSGRDRPAGGVAQAALSASRWSLASST